MWPPLIVRQAHRISQMETQGESAPRALMDDILYLQLEQSRSSQRWLKADLSPVSQTGLERKRRQVGEIKFELR